MRILGIDQGIASMGYAILEFVDGNVDILEYGQLSTYPDPCSDNLCGRISDIVFLLEEIVNEFEPDRICCEKLFYNAPGQRNKSASIVNTNIASGLVMYLCGKYDIDFREYAPTSVKAKIAENGKADKEEIKQHVFGIYPFMKDDVDFLTEHMIDAVAIATTSWIVHGEDGNCEIDEEIEEIQEEQDD